MQCNMIGHIHKLNKQRKYEHKKKKQKSSLLSLSIPIVMTLIEMEKNICFIAKTLKLQQRNKTNYTKNIDKKLKYVHKFDCM